MTKLIAGDGGFNRAAASAVGYKGRQAQGTPNTDPDSLDSSQYATILDLLSEGEIEGLVGGAKGIYLDNTPLQNPDGSLNFTNVQADARNGTQNQTFIPIASDISNEIPVGVVVLENTPIVRTITDPTVGAVRITLSFPRLEQYQADGDIRGVSVRLRLSVQYNGGGYVTVIEDTVRGRTADLYQRDYRITFTSNVKPVDIKVQRLSEDSASPQYVDAFQWTSYTELTYGRLSYPNSALVALRINAEQFSNIPSRSYRIRGIKVKVPTSVAYVDQTNGRLVYASGPWNGLFTAAAWTTDPAWILYDLLISKRYGFGDHIIEAQLDKWAFLAASQYCAELVSDGFGGVEPRFTCNVAIQTAEDAYKLISDMCSVFRAMPFWSGGAVTISQDRPVDSSYLFTLANVGEDGFTYQGSSLKQRPTVAVVSYLDLESRDIAYEAVEDQAAIARYGVVTTEISAFACTSRGQAHRIGEWLLYSEQYEGEIVTFTTSLDAGVMVRPGQIIEIADPVRAGTRRGGRIVAATTTTITLDDITSISALTSGTISVITPSGGVQSRTYVSRSGSIVTVTPAFSVAPNVNSVWVWQTNDVQTSTWRVLGVQEQEQSQYTISALSYNVSKYNYVERGVPLQARDITNLNIVPPPPAALSASETLYESNGRAESKIVVSWRSVSGVLNYRLRYRFGNDNWVTVDSRAAVDYEITNSQPGIYSIEVYSLSPANIPSRTAAQLTVNTYGKTALPANITGLNLVPIDSASAILSWDRATDLDVVLGGKILIRHNPLLVGATWEQSAEIVAATAGGQTQKQVPLLEGTYLVKAEDDGGRRSAAASTVVADLPTPQPRLLVLTYREDLETPPFSGNTTGMFYSADQSGIIISGGIEVDSMATDGNWDGLVSIDAVGGINASGSYEFGSTLDLGGVYDINLRRILGIAPFVPGELIDDKTANIDDWTGIDDLAPDDVNAALYVRSTADDPSGTPTWGEWQEFANAIVRGRGFQFQVVATSADPSHNISIETLGVEVELQQRIAEPAAVITSGTSTYSVSFAAPFYQAPQIGITAYNMGTGDYFAITAVTRTGFDVTFRNSAATVVSRQFTYSAIGYGREII